MPHFRQCVRRRPRAGCATVAIPKVHPARGSGAQWAVTSTSAQRAMQALVRIVFQLVFRGWRFAEQSCGAFCSSCTQAADCCDREGLGASEGADGLGVCQWVRCSERMHAVGFGAGRRDQKRGTVRRGVSWDAAIRLVVLAPQALLQSKAGVGASYSDGCEHDTDSPSRVGRNRVGGCPALAVWLGARRC